MSIHAEPCTAAPPTTTTTTMLDGALADHQGRTLRKLKLIEVSSQVKLKQNLFSVLVLIFLCFWKGLETLEFLSESIFESLSNKPHHVQPKTCFAAAVVVSVFYGQGLSVLALGTKAWC